MQKLDEVVKKIPKSKDYITVPEAYALFGISKETLYRLIRKGVISSVNVGERQIRLSKEELLKLYPLRKKALAKPKPIAKLYSLEPKDCYTIGEISKKFHLEDSTVYLHIRKYSIPTRQIGNFVYVPKKEIDNLYKGRSNEESVGQYTSLGKISASRNTARNGIYMWKPIRFFKQTNPLPRECVNI